MITQKQVQILRSISTYIENNGFSPTVREIRDVLDLKSTSTVKGHLDNLEKLGCISKAPSSPRTLVITEKREKLIETFN